MGNLKQCFFSEIKGISTLPTLPAVSVYVPVKSNKLEPSSEPLSTTEEPFSSWVILASDCCIKSSNQYQVSHGLIYFLKKILNSVLYYENVDVNGMVHFEGMEKNGFTLLSNFYVNKLNSSSRTNISVLILIWMHWMWIVGQMI